MESKRQNGWTYQHLGHNKALKLGEESKGMEHVVHIGSFPVNEDGQEIELPGDSVDLVEQIHRRTQREAVLATAATDRDRLILTRMFAGKSHSAIADELGITRERVRQLADRALARAKEMVAR